MHDPCLAFTNQQSYNITLFVLQSKITAGVRTLKCRTVMNSMRICKRGPIGCGRVSMCIQCMYCASNRTHRRNSITLILVQYEGFAREGFWPRLQRMITTSLRRPLVRSRAKCQCIFIASAKDKETKSDATCCYCHLRTIAFYLPNTFPIMPSTGDEDPSGDIILVVGDDQVRISASSQLLCIASRPFSKMLGPNFKEGQPDDAGARREISLPDDKPSAIDLMCNIIHYRIHELSLAPTAAKLHDLAIVSDKYDCIQATSLAAIA
jgi:hypothetical protein